MSGSRSFLQRTEDLKRLKTRALYLEDEYGVGPGPNTVPHFAPSGAMDFTNVKIIDGGDSVDIPGYLNVDGDVDIGGDLTVAGSISGFIDVSSATIQNLITAVATIQDLSANHIWTNTEVVASRLDICGSAAVLGGLSIGQVHGIHELDVNGHAFINSDGSASRAFTVPGIYTFAVPASISTLSFEMIGAGGLPGGGNNIGGTGGYMRGTINISAFAGQTLTVQVGRAGGPTSYISIAGTGPLFTVAGAGGGGGGPSNGVNGGAGGGDVFVGGVSNGKDGVDYPGIGNSRGLGGSTVGGAGGIPSSGPEISNGQAGASPAGYVDAAGGASGVGARGGNGYAGGGESGSVAFGAGSGGGGSSFYNTTYVSLSANFAGDNAGLVGILTGYGRSGQGGYVSISYAGQPSLQTTGDIVCGGNLDVCGSFAIQGQFDICGNLSVGGYIDGIRMAGSFYYRQPSGGLYRVPQRVLVYSEAARPISSTAAAIQLSVLGAPFDSLTKIEIEMNGSISIGAILYIDINNISSFIPVAQGLLAATTTLFTAKHTFEMSKRFTTRLLDYGSCEAIDSGSATTGFYQYHPNSIDLIPSTTINELYLKTGAPGDTASIDIEIYAYV